MKRISRFILGFLVCWAGTLQAQPSQDFPPAALRQLWREISRNHLSLRQLDQTIHSLELEKQAQKASLLPVLATASSYSHISDIARFTLPVQLPGVPPTEAEAGVRNQYDAALVVQQPIFTGFRIRSQIRAADWRKRSVQFKKQALQNQLYFQAGRLFYDLQLNQLQQQVLQKSLQRVELQLQKVRSFLQAQQASAYDTLEVSNRRLQLVSQLQRLKTFQRVLESKLKFLAHTEELPQPFAEGLPRPELQMQPLEAYLAAAFENRPELQELPAMQQAQKQMVQAARSAYYPNISAAASYHYARPGVNFFADQWMTYFTVGVHIQWRLWDWQQIERKVQQARAEYTRLQLQSEYVRREIVQQVEEAYHSLLTAKEQILLQEQLVREERRRYQWIAQRYEQGFVSLLDLRSAEMQLTTSELQLQKNYVEWYASRLQLLLATGQIGY